jgi:hypothetical protein
MSFQTEPSASSAVLDASASSVSSRVMVIDGLNIEFFEDSITDDLMTYTDNSNLNYQPLLYPKHKTITKILGGKIVVSEDCFIENTENIDCVICMEKQPIMFKGLCPCNLSECKECFLERVSKQFYNNFNATRCLSNNHKGACYCKLVKEAEQKIETIQPITAQQIIKYRKEKNLMKMMEEYNFDVYEANVKDKDFNLLPLCFQIFKVLCDRVETSILTNGDLDVCMNAKKQFYFYEDDDVSKPIRWGLGGYDWDDKNSWRYGHTTFYVISRDRLGKRFIKTRISFDEDEQILDTLETHIVDSPKAYGREYAFDLMKHNYQLALGNNADSDAFRAIYDNDDLEELLMEMIDNKKTIDVCRQILDNDDVNICELMGCECFEYEQMEGDDNTDYYINYYDEGVELQ